MKQLAGTLACTLLACGISMAAPDCLPDQPQGINPPTRLPEDFAGVKKYVCLYGSIPQASQTPSFWLRLIQTFPWPAPKKRPFGRSIAFLTGVSRYDDRAFDRLDFVNNDLTKLRNFLLTEGGFDAVYEARDENVTEEVINRYMRGYFAKRDGNWLAEDDRLLFYFSGHGGEQSRVPYLIFGAARAGDYTQGVLPAEQVRDWARIVVAKHLLIVLDSCFAGLVPFTKGPSGNSAPNWVAALSGEGSGNLLMAGTGDEAAYAEELANRQKGSVFTDALIEALGSGSKDSGFITIEEAFGRVKKRVASFVASGQGTMTPSWMPLSRLGGEMGGEFLFINNAAPKTLQPPRALYSGAPIPKESDTNQLEPNPVEVAAEASGLVVGRLTPPDAQRFISRAADAAQAILSCDASIPAYLESSCHTKVAEIGRIVVDLKGYGASFPPLESWVRDVASKSFQNQDRTNAYTLLLSFAERLEEFSGSKEVTKDEAGPQYDPAKCGARDLYKDASSLSTFLATCDIGAYVCNDEPRLKNAVTIRDRLAILKPEGLDLAPLKRAVQDMQKGPIEKDQNDRKEMIVAILDQLATELNSRSQGISDEACKSR
jgi:hypothetical protein